MSPAIRPVKVLAAGWLFGALGLSLSVAPLIGWRGCIWVGVFAGLSAIGAAWELWVRAPGVTT